MAPDRPLSMLEGFYVDYGVLRLNPILKLPGVHLGSKKKIAKALQMTIRASPHLTNVVVPSPENKDAYVFQYRSVEDKSKWQKPNFVELKNGATSDDEALSQIKEVHSRQLSEYDISKEMRMKVPFCFNVCQTPTTTFLGVVVMHHNMDGSALWSFFSKFLLYIRLPKVFWGPLGRICKDQFPLPSYYSMIQNEKKIEGEFSPVEDNKVFHFKNFDPSTTALVSKRVELGRTINVMSQCREALRAKGVTVSSVFTALAMKVMAHLSQDFSPDLVNEGPILGDTPIDLRNKWEWGHKHLLPVVANYSSSCRTKTPVNTLLECPIEALALNIKQSIQSYQTDPEVRLMEVDKLTVPGSVFCGVSSTMSPSDRVERLLRIKHMEQTEADTDPNSPLCWFSVTSRGGTETSVRFVLCLPKEVMISEDKIRTVINESVSGSVVEPLFPNL
eukprot:CAMPEP_0168736816 /NCGR_PEP_ID=MMETSP0724-20121128/10057_1 /TAXON_ID=265536 /ORGANISM="Amphiprora sp., Strain CCMP467" /LENGTH=444 /DNA_ID=CAMNT_0008784029 /DNA_START=98 /DNA_END=1432 /DNA_ORIENTATION=+